MVLPFIIIALVWGDPPTGLPRTIPGAPTVSVSIEHTAPYARGDRVRVRVRVRAGSYLTVLRVDTQGRIHVLYPSSPRNSGRVGRNNGLSAPIGFKAGRTQGVGYVVAFASTQPFDYRSLSRAGRWHFSPDWRQISGDPLESLIRRVAVLSSSVGYDQVAYRIGGAFEFPRFACTGCHAPIPGWDPYAGRCSRVDLEIVQSPADYVYRIAGPRSAVARPSRALPRLVFRASDREASMETTPSREHILNQWRRNGAPAPDWIREGPRSTGKPAPQRRVPQGSAPRSSLPAIETPTRPGSYD